MIYIYNAIDVVMKVVIRTAIIMYYRYHRWYCEQKLRR